MTIETAQTPTFYASSWTLNAANDERSGTTWLLLKNFVEGLHALRWLSNPLTLQDMSYNKPSQHVKLDIKRSKSKNQI